jgi:hypothetical protein
MSTSTASTSLAWLERGSAAVRRAPLWWYSGTTSPLHPALSSLLPLDYSLSLREDVKRRKRLRASEVSRGGIPNIDLVTLF